MTIRLTSEELSVVLSQSELVQSSAKAVGWKRFTTSVYESRDEELGGFVEIDLHEAQEGAEQ